MNLSVNYDAFDEKYFAAMNEKCSEIAALIKECEEKNIPTDYEQVDYAVLERFIGRMKVEVEKKIYTRTEYYAECLEDAYNDAKSRLCAYLSGEKKSVPGTRYITGDVRIEGSRFVGKAKTGDKIEEQPLFLNGIIGFEQANEELPYLQSFGLNSAEPEMGPDSILKPKGTPGCAEELGDDLFDIDLTAVEKYRKVFASADENNIWLGFLLSSHYFPQFIFDKYPDLRQPDGGPGFFRFELAHPIAKRVLSKFYEILLPRIEEFTCVNNYILSNEPSYCCTYSDYTLPQWYEYLKGIYGNIDALNEAYESDYKAFEEVGFPCDPVTKRPIDDGSLRVYDLIKFNRGIMNDFHQFMADEVRKYTNKPLSIKVQNQFGQTDWHDPRQMPIMTATDLEAMSDMTEIAGNDAWWMLSAPASGTTINEKFFFYDFQRCYKEQPVYDSEEHIIADGEHRYTKEHADKIYTDFWQGMMHGRNASTLWLWLYDFNGLETADHFAMRPDCIRKTGKVTFDLNRLAREMTSLMEVPAKAAVLYSHASRIYSKSHMEHAFSAYRALLFSGQKVDIISETQPEKLKNYKFLVLPDITNIPKETLAAVAELVKNGGKVVAMGADGMLMHDERKAANDKETVSYVLENATVINTVSEENVVVSPSVAERQEIIRTALKDAGIYDVDLVDANTGKTVENVEWRMTEYEGRTLIDICSYKFYKPLDLKIVIGGKTVSSCVDLIDGGEFAETVHLEPYKPLLIEVK